MRNSSAACFLYRFQRLQLGVGLVQPLQLFHEEVEAVEVFCAPPLAPLAHGLFRRPKKHGSVGETKLPLLVLYPRRIFNFYNGRKWIALNVDFLVDVGYTTNVAISLQFDGHIEAHRLKQRFGSFFLQKQELAGLQEVSSVFFGRNAVHFSFRVCTGHLLHIRYGKTVSLGTQIHSSQYWLPVLRFVSSEHNNASLLGLAFQHHRRILQNLGDLFDLCQRHLRMLMQNRFDFVTLHVDVALNGAQPLQHRSRAAEGEPLPFRRAGLAPCVDFAAEFFPQGVTYLVVSAVFTQLYPCSLNSVVVMEHGSKQVIVHAFVDISADVGE